MHSEKKETKEEIKEKKRDIFYSDTYIQLRAYLCGAFNKLPDFFVQASKIVVDSWKFILLSYCNTPYKMTD